MTGCCKNRNEFFSTIKEVEFLGPFASSRKARFGFPLSVLPYVCLSVCVTVRLSACIGASPTGWIFAKYNIGDCYENLSINFTFRFFKECHPRCVGELRGLEL